MTPNSKKHILIFFPIIFGILRRLTLFFQSSQWKKMFWLVKNPWKFGFVFVKSLRVLNCYLMKLQLYKCGIWKSWAPSWNRTNMLSRQSETLLIMISFNFSQIIKALRNLWSVNFSLAYLSYVSTSYYFLNCKKKSREITDVQRFKNLLLRIYGSNVK